MTTQLDGQLDLLDLLPPACLSCGSVADSDSPYSVRSFSREHIEVEAGACKEMVWARRGYLHSRWAVENFAIWYKLAPPGSESYAKQLRSTMEERDRFKDRCAGHTARIGHSWQEEA